MISVTHTWMPPKEKLLGYIDEIYRNGVFTNNGSLIRELEGKLKDHLEVPNLHIVSNGHIAIMMAIKALELKGAILTSPFSFVSTIQSILWQGCYPVFADIDSRTFGMDPVAIEEALNKDKSISAILPTHLFGNACDVEAIESLGKKYNVPVIYDAAHSFGVTYKGRSLLTYGDVSAISFQAYKAFHMVEGGAVVSASEAVSQRLFDMRYFGINLKEEIVGAGLNGKASELHAAVGLCSLEIQHEAKWRKQITWQKYRDSLKELPFQWMETHPGTEMNYSYMPVVLSSPDELKGLQNWLSARGIQTKRYFQPALNTLKQFYTAWPMPNAEYISQRVLCLPIHFDLLDSEIDEVIAAIQDFFQKGDY